MKIKYLIMLALVSCSLFAFSAARNTPTEPAGFTIGTDSLMIAAPRLVSAPNWVSGASYSHGDMVRSTNNPRRIYWNVSGVTNEQVTVTMPDHLNGDATDGGTNVWRRIKPRARVGIEVINPGTNDLWLAVGSDAVANTGIYLVSGGGSWSPDGSMQSAVYAVATNGTLATTQEY